VTSEQAAVVRLGKVDGHRISKWLRRIQRFLEQLAYRAAFTGKRE